LKPNGSYLHTVLAGAALKGLWYALTTGKHIIGGTAAPRREALTFLSELSETGRLKPVIDRSYALEEIADAHRMSKRGANRAMSLLRWSRQAHDPTLATARSISRIVERCARICPVPASARRCVEHVPGHFRSLKGSRFKDHHVDHHMW
jgi:hypothetical protein